MTLPENEKKPDKKEKPLTKVIIRRLPPTMDQETFLNQVSPIPDYNYIYTVKGDSSLGEYAFSRVYINFMNPDDIFNFKERFDNYVFLDNKGHEYPAVVEFASFQKIPKKRGKVRMDPKCGTIETDPVYIEFVESLNKPQELDEKPEYTLQLEKGENKDDVTTPLLEYIKNKRAQRMRIREVRREERKRREFDRKKDRYDDRRRPNEEKSPLKTSSTKPSFKSSSTTRDEKDEVETTVETKVEEKYEKTEKVYEKSSYYKNKERKFEDRRKDIKPRFPRKEYPEHRDYKRSDDYKERDYRSKYDDYKKDSDTRSYTKKVKKYSEKREERKMEVQKAEQKKLDQAKEVKTEKEETKPVDVKNAEGEDTTKTKFDEKEQKNKENDPQRRIRNKDRPTIAIYRPGMLSKRKQTDGETSDAKDIKNEGKN